MEISGCGIREEDTLVARTNLFSPKSQTMEESIATMPANESRETGGRMSDSTSSGGKTPPKDEGSSSSSSTKLRNRKEKKAVSKQIWKIKNSSDSGTRADAESPDSTEMQTMESDQPEPRPGKEEVDPPVIVPPTPTPGEAHDPVLDDVRRETTCETVLRVVSDCCSGKSAGPAPKIAGPVPAPEPVVMRQQEAVVAPHIIVPLVQPNPQVAAPAQANAGAAPANIAAQVKALDTYNKQHGRMLHMNNRTWSVRPPVAKPFIEGSGMVGPHPVDYTTGPKEVDGLTHLDLPPDSTFEWGPKVSIGAIYSWLFAAALILSQFTVTMLLYHHGSYHSKLALSLFSNSFVAALVIGPWVYYLLYRTKWVKKNKIIIHTNTLNMYPDVDLRPDANSYSDLKHYSYARVQYTYVNNDPESYSETRGYRNLMWVPLSVWQLKPKSIILEASAELVAQALSSRYAQTCREPSVTYDTFVNVVGRDQLSNRDRYAPFKDIWRDQNSILLAYGMFMHDRDRKRWVDFPRPI
jgi:hypothetical protein